MRRSLVVGVDETSDSITALRRAAEIAQTADYPLVVVHVRHRSTWAGLSAMSAAGDLQNLDQIEAETRRATDETLADFPRSWDFIVRTGDPAHELIAVAKERWASYIVVGGRPHSAVGAAVLGSVATALVHHFRGSVLVVRSEEDSQWITSEYARDKARMDHAIDAIYGERYSA
jgi:nucleotide-binding universal stress UspA family protein